MIRTKRAYPGDPQDALPNYEAHLGGSSYKRRQGSVYSASSSQAMSAPSHDYYQSPCHGMPPPQSTVAPSAVFSNPNVSPVGLNFVFPEDPSQDDLNAFFGEINQGSETHGQLTPALSTAASDRMSREIASLKHAPDVKARPRPEQEPWNSVQPTNPQGRRILCARGNLSRPMSTASTAPPYMFDQQSYAMSNKAPSEYGSFSFNDSAYVTIASPGMSVQSGPTSHSKTPGLEQGSFQPSDALLDNPVHDLEFDAFAPQGEMGAPNDYESTFSLPVATMPSEPSLVDTKSSSKTKNQIYCNWSECDARGPWNPNQFKKHIGRHTKPHVCDLPNCKPGGARFATPNDLVRHQKSVHKVVPNDAKDKTYICAAPTCKSKPKSWPRADNFKQHINRLHKDWDVNELMQKSVEPRPQALKKGMEQDSSTSTRDDDSTKQDKTSSTNSTSTSAITAHDKCTISTSSSLPQAKPANMPKYIGATTQSPPSDADKPINQTTGHVRDTSVVTPQDVMKPPPVKLPPLDNRAEDAKYRSAASSRVAKPVQQKSGSSIPIAPTSRTSRGPFTNDMKEETPCIKVLPQPKASTATTRSLSKKANTFPIDKKSASATRAVQAHNGTASSRPTSQQATAPSKLSEHRSGSAGYRRLVPYSPTPAISSKLPLPISTSAPSNEMKKILETIELLRGVNMEVPEVLLMKLKEQKASIPQQQHHRSAGRDSNFQRSITPAEDSKQDGNERGLTRLLNGQPPRSAVKRAEQMYRCDQCQKVKKTLSDLKKHYLRHTRPYICTMGENCAKTFGSKNDWKRHERTVHGDVTYLEAWWCPLPFKQGRENAGPDNKPNPDQLSNNQDYNDSSADGDRCDSLDGGNDTGTQRGEDENDRRCKEPHVPNRSICQTVAWSRDDFLTHLQTIHHIPIPLDNLPPLHDYTSPTSPANSPPPSSSFLSTPDTASPLPAHPDTNIPSSAQGPHKPLTSLAEIEVRAHIARHGLRNFWCGYCNSTIPIDPYAAGRDAWEARYRHVDEVHFKVAAREGGSSSSFTANNHGEEDRKYLGKVAEAWGSGSELLKAEGMSKLGFRYCGPGDDAGAHSQRGNGEQPRTNTGLAWVVLGMGGKTKYMVLLEEAKEKLRNEGGDGNAKDPLEQENDLGTGPRERENSAAQDPIQVDDTVDEPSFFSDEEAGAEYRDLDEDAAGMQHGSERERSVAIDVEMQTPASLTDGLKNGANALPHPTTVAGEEQHPCSREGAGADDQLLKMARRGGLIGPASSEMDIAEGDEVAETESERQKRTRSGISGQASSTGIDTGYGGAAVLGCGADGKKTKKTRKRDRKWYCCVCKDGPYSVPLDQVTCQMCSHKRCSICLE